MYEKIKNFFKEHWFALLIIIGLSVAVCLGVRAVRSNIDIDINARKNSLSIDLSRTKSSNKHKTN